MQMLTKYRKPDLAQKMMAKVIPMADTLAGRLGRPVVLMEVCGTHTMAISRTGMRSLLGKNLELRSGPGCPVCVTDYIDLDRAVMLARLPAVCVATFGDMVRVPGSCTSLERERAAGARVRVCYSPNDAVGYAAEHPAQEVVFLGVGFETTAPGVALSLMEAKARGVKNYSVLSLHKLVPPVMRVLLADPGLPVDGFLLPGHVSTIIGRRAFDFLATDYGLPAVITGFELLDILGAIYQILTMLLRQEIRVDNGYARVVRETGNVKARQFMQAFFAPVAVSWRGFGTIQESGLGLRKTYRHYDALEKFRITVPAPRVPRGCRCGDLLRGKIKPDACPLFARACTPTRPVGPCMVSSEGACAAYFQYEFAEQNNSMVHGEEKRA
jgi:hydrogenase expression/formation protein HypD